MKGDYFAPDRRNGNIIYSYKPLPGAEDEIYRRIGDITISMKSTDYLDRPDLVTSEYTVTLDEAEREKYEAMKRDLLLRLPDGEVTAANAASLSGKLSQMANGAVYADDGSVTAVHDRKLDALEDIIESANGSPLLIAYWYKHDLERISYSHTKRQAGQSGPGCADSACLRRTSWQAGQVCAHTVAPGISARG